MLVYIDNILVYSRSIPEPRCQVTEVLKKLQEFNLILKAEKCQFHQSEIKCLDYNISQDVVSMDERKVDANRNWPIPTILFSMESPSLCPGPLKPQMPLNNCSKLSEVLRS